MVLFQMGPIQKIPLDAPQIIHEASKSPLGIFALMLLVLAVLAYVFFKGKKPAVTIPIFAGMFIGVVSYGVALANTSSRTYTYKISGRVVDSQTKDPLEGASVRLEWGELIEKDDSDSDGEYRLTVRQTDDALPSRIRLEADAPGYKTYTRTVDDPLQNTPVTLAMRKTTPSGVAEQAAAAPSRNLQPLSCDQLPTLKSDQGDAATQVVFKNLKNIPVQVFWLDYSAHEQFYFELKPNTMELVQTYLSHPWVIRSVEGKCLDIFVSKVATPSEAEIN
jgi:hypothetical protein